jgi:hypothetical protein
MEAGRTKMGLLRQTRGFHPANVLDRTSIDVAVVVGISQAKPLGDEQLDETYEDETNDRP